MADLKWYNYKAVRFIMQIILTFTGFTLLALQMYEGIFSLGGGDNPWNVRLFVIACLLMIAVGYGMSGQDLDDKLYRGFTAFAILFIIQFAVGTFWVVNDAYATEVDAIIAQKNIEKTYWFAFDSFNANMKEVGELIVLITQSVVTAVPIGILIFTVISIFHGDTTDDYQTAILEGGMAFVFMVAYAWLGSNFGWFISLGINAMDTVRILQPVIAPAATALA